MLFSEYYANWIELYKEGAVRDVTLKKYKAALAHIKNLVPDLDISDMSRQTLSINKTYDYKHDGGFVDTKNKSSIRKIPLDWQTLNKFYGYIKDKDADKPIFVNPDEKIYDSTINDNLFRHCKKANVADITFHGLRHTHASVLLFSGVSVPSVSRRLGHSSIATTQKVYLHIIKEMDNFDNDIIMKTLVSLD